MTEALSEAEFPAYALPWPASPHRRAATWTYLPLTALMSQADPPFCT
jgi:hypothetical protein